MPEYYKMENSSSRKAGLRRFPIKVILSYVLDWVVLIAVAVVSLILGNIEPNKRPFSLADPNISFPFTEHETVPPWLLLVLNAILPIAGVAIIALIFVPGATVPRDTPKSLIWKRKLWELHVGWLGLATALVSAWFFTQGMKNMFGKPRPDLLDRCQPDIENAANYVVGGFAGESTLSRLYSADICTQTDRHKLDDGFRSYPSGHSSSAAAGLIYLSLFIASKFAVTIPFVASGNTSADPIARAAFPSRQSTNLDPYEPSRGYSVAGGGVDDHTPTSAVGEKVFQDNARHNAKIQSLRRQAAAPPLYLLVITILPFCVAIFIASSRWFDFRHHGFDILFGFLMGTITGIYSFFYYHLPLRDGAGWAWGPRSEARAFWAGVGRLGYAGEGDNLGESNYRQPIGRSSDTSYQSPYAGQAGLVQRHSPEQTTGTASEAQDVELHDFDSRAARAV